MAYNLVVANSGYINCSSSSTLNDIETQGGGGLSISFWIYPRTAGAGNFGYCVAKVNSEAVNEGYWEIFFASVATALSFKKNYTTADLVRRMSNGSLTVNVWQHVVLTWDGSSTAANAHYYINGTEPSYLTTTNGSGTKNSDALLPFLIGNSFNGVGSGDHIITEVGLWNVVLNNSEIQALAKSRVKGIPLQIRPSALVGYWPLDDFPDGLASGATLGIRDRTKNNNNGTQGFATGGGNNTFLAEQILSYT